MSKRNVTFADSSAEFENTMIKIIALKAWPHGDKWTRRYDLAWTAHYIETARKVKDAAIIEGNLMLAESVESVIHNYNSEIRTPSQISILKTWEIAGDDWATWGG